jgi:hypothetical protein
MGRLTNLNPSKALTEADLPGTIATDTEVAAAIAAHVNTSDSHPTYLTQTEGDARYRQTATALTDSDIPTAIARDLEVAAAVAAHVNAVDPHLQYPTQARGDARYIANEQGLVLKLKKFTGTTNATTGPIFYTD